MKNNRPFVIPNKRSYLITYKSLAVNRKSSVFVHSVFPTEVKKIRAHILQRDDRSNYFTGLAVENILLPAFGSCLRAVSVLHL